MAAYIFEAMTSGQGASYSAAADTIVFGSFAPFTGANAGNTQVVFNGSIVTIVEVTGSAVTFGSGIFGETDFLFPDASRLFVGTAGGDSFTAASTNDHLYGWNGADVLSGGGGNDTLVGGAGADTLTSGSGSDLIVIAAGETGTTLAQADVVTDWSSSDTLAIGGLAGAPNNYIELAGPGSFAAAVNVANQQIQAGIRIVAMQVGGDVIVFADSTGSGTTFEDVVVLSGKALSDVSAGNFAQSAATSPPPPPPPPPGPSAGDDVLTGTASGDVIDGLGGNDRISGLDANDNLAGNDGADTLDGGDGVDTLNGGAGRDQIFTGDGGDVIEIGLRQSGVTGSTADIVMDWSSSDKLHFAGLTTNSVYREETAADFATAAAAANALIASGSVDMVAYQIGADVAVFADSGNDDGVADDVVALVGRTLADISAANFIVALATSPPPPPPPPGLNGTTGADALTATASVSEVHAGAGDDAITVSGSMSTYLRGDEGDDTITGGSGFDDINGNMGNDTAHGGLGDDWVVGGKDQDRLYGDEGVDIVYGNLGDDSCDGGTGADLIRGGQGADTLSGGDGDDWLSGDRGDDTISGGAGADVFHSFGDAGIDRVLDFSVAQGDRVMLDPGTQWTVAQVGGDTVISMTGGAQMTLVGVQMSTLPTGWIFGA